jgi:uncharacterized protein involved in outer membrane biogenesis
VDSPAVWLERLADRRNNWTFDTGPETGESPWHLDVGEIVLERGNLSLNDGAEKIELQATLDTIGDQPLYDQERDGALAPSADASAASAPPARQTRRKANPRAVMASAGRSSAITTRPRSMRRARPAPR